MVEAEEKKMETEENKSENTAKEKNGRQGSKNKEIETKKDEMTEEDKKLQQDLDLLMDRLGESDESLYQSSLETMRTLIRASTTSMTSVPKPLKFMRPHYEKLKTVHLKISNKQIQKLCADIISVLAMVCDDQGDCLKYRLIGSYDPIGDWGIEYVRHVCKELVDEWRKLENDDDKLMERDHLLKLAEEIVVHDIKHNAEVEACDLLIEIEKIHLLLDYVDEVDYPRVCLYLLSCAPLTPDPDNLNLIQTAKNLYLKFERKLEALRCAIMLNDIEAIREIFLNCEDKMVQKQMAILLGRHQIFLELTENDGFEALAELNSNASLYEYFHSLGRELDIMEPKTPDQIYKTHMEQSRPLSGSVQPDSARMNLAAALVNGFVNTGFGCDKMMGETSETANAWFYKNKEFGMLSAAASQGLIWRWEIDAGLSHCDRFLYVQEDFIKAGTLLAIGIISSGIQDPSDPASALLIDNIHSDRPVMRIGSVLGLGLAYANSKREAVTMEEEGGVIFELRKVLSDTKASATFEVKGLAGLSLGLICVGTADHAVAQDMLTQLMDKTEQELKHPNMRFLALGIALVFLGTQEKSAVFVNCVRVLPEPFGSMTATLIDSCAYAGTGNVLKIQELLHICLEHYETAKTEDKEKQKETSTATNKEEAKLDLSSKQEVAVLGIAMIAMGEDIGSQMSLRMFDHMMRYGEVTMRRAVPLALGLISVSNPQLSIMEKLNKFSHDSDADTAHSAIFALGLVGAGTNNARLVNMLRQLASYHAKDSVGLMLVRIAQGMIHMGKGTMTLNPFHSDRQLLCPAALAALFSVCFAFLDANNTVLSNRQHYLFYGLVPAIQPRLLITLIEDELDPEQLKQINVHVRVGQAVDIVAQAGKPKTITGFQTHTTPVLLAYGERAELASEEYIPLSPYLEGLVILKKNPDYNESSTAKK